jgi:hypothetical protein
MASTAAVLVIGDASDAAISLVGIEMGIATSLRSSQ